MPCASSTCSMQDAKRLGSRVPSRSATPGVRQSACPGEDSPVCWNNGVRGRNSAVKKTSRGRPRLEDIRSMLRDKLPELEARYGVRSLGLFGSYARGEAKSRSDLDVLVEFARTPTLFEFTELEEYLTTLLDVKVELVSRKALRGARGERILEEVTHL